MPGTPTRQRTGRPPVLPVDRTPLNAGRVDHAARVGWLHLTARALSGTTRGTLSRRLGEAGVVADTSRLSRWESGRQQPSTEVTAAYEEALGLAPGRLLAPVRAVVRSGDHRPPGLEQAPTDLDDLLEQVLEPWAPATGGTWLRLAVGLSHHDHVFLREREWRTLSRRLVSELARTVGVDHHRRHEACVTLLDVPGARPHLLRAVGEWVTRRGVQVVTPVLSLLSGLPGDRDATDELVLRLLGSRDPQLVAGTVPVAASLLDRGHLAPAHVGRLEQLCARRLATTQDVHLAVDLLDVAVRLPEGSFDRVLSAQRDAGIRTQLEAIRSSSTLLPDVTNRRLARSLAWRVQSGTDDHEPPDPDQMLVRLVREALFHVHGARRQLAGRTLAASPYGHRLATHVAALTSDPRDLLATRAWELLLVLGHGDGRDTVVQHATEATYPFQSAALLSLGLGGRRLTPEERDAVVGTALRTEHARVRYTATLALGLAAPAALPALDGLDQRTDRAVTWWRRTGSLLRDPDAVPSTAVGYD